jgi:hypothetical protein
MVERLEMRNMSRVVEVSATAAVSRLREGNLRQLRLVDGAL